MRFLQSVLGVFVFYRRGQQICHSLEKMNVILSKKAGGVGMDTENPKRPLLAIDNNADTTYHPVIVQQRRLAKASITLKVGYNNRLTGKYGIPNMGIGPGIGGYLANQPWLPT